MPRVGRVKRLENGNNKYIEILKKNLGIKQSMQDLMVGLVLEGFIMQKVSLIVFLIYLEVSHLHFKVILTLQHKHYCHM